jgi:hypothetical protein
MLRFLLAGRTCERPLMGFNCFFVDTYCRWTAWLSIDSGGLTDKEDLPGLVKIL